MEHRDTAGSGDRLAESGGMGRGDSGGRATGRHGSRSNGTGSSGGNGGTSGYDSLNGSDEGSNEPGAWVDAAAREPLEFSCAGGSSDARTSGSGESACHLEQCAGRRF